MSAMGDQPAPDSNCLSAAGGPRSVPHSPWYDAFPLRVLALLGLLCAAPAYERFHLSSLGNADIWWHLRTGLWTLQEHAIPRDGLFSLHEKLSWVDSSWGFDLLTAAAYRVLGLRGLPALFMVLQAGVVAALFVLARGPRKNFWPAIFLVAVALCCISPLQLRPALCSIMFLSAELAMLFDVQRTGDLWPLYVLPVLFVVWVNFDGQFSYGLLVLALFCLDSIIEMFLPRAEDTASKPSLRELPLVRLGVVFVASCLATVASPYGYRLPQLVWRSASSTAVDRYLAEFHSLRFRQPQDYLLLLLAMTAFLVLGRRRSRKLFAISLLVVLSMISFRLQRDSWLVVVASVGIIGNALAISYSAEVRDDDRRISRSEIMVVVGLVVVVLVAFTLTIPAQPETLLAKVSQTFPVRASDFIRRNRLSQPLFNTYSWGGFLTWYLPEYPVAIDGRLDLYGDAVNIPYFEMTLAKIPLESNPDFAQAQTILLEANSPIAEALATEPEFRVAYRDDQAMVLVRRALQ